LPLLNPALPAKLRALASASHAWLLACIGAVTAVLYWRRPDAFYNPQLWAEDGSRFFTNAFFLGPRSLVVPYGGYFHTLARMAAWAGTWTPVRYAPHWYVFASWALLVCIVGYVFSTRLPFSNGLKFLLGLALVTTTADNEVFFNLSNWATLSSLFWLLLALAAEPRSRREALSDGMVLALAGLNSPFAICFWLAFLLRWAVRRTQHSFRLLLLSLGVALIQVWNMPARAQIEGGVAPTLSSLYVDGIINRFGFMFLGDQINKLQLTPFLRVCGLGIVLGAYGGLIVFAGLRRNWAQLTVLAGGIAAALVNLYVLRNVPALIRVTAGRHFYIPAVTFAWALLLSTRRWSWPPLTMMFVAFLFWTPGNKSQVLPNLDWAGHVSRCTGTQHLCRIPVNPVWDPPVWYAAMNSRVFAVPPVQTEFASTFGEQIELLGYDAVQSRPQLSVKFVWRAIGNIGQDYKFFVHLFERDDPTRILVQADGMPLNWQYPTSLWVDKEIVVDQVNLSLDKLSSGTYNLAIGWYDANSPAMTRLDAYDSQAQAWKDARVILPLTVVVP
jgi:hypothetical protein